MKWRTVIIIGALLLVMGAVFSQIQNSRLKKEEDKAHDLAVRVLQQTQDIERQSSQLSRRQTSRQQRSEWIASLQEEAAAEGKLAKTLEEHFEELRVAEQGVTSRRDYLDQLSRERAERLAQTRRRIIELEEVVVPDVKRRRARAKRDLENIQATQRELQSDYDTVVKRLNRASAHVARLEDKLERWKEFQKGWDFLVELSQLPEWNVDPYSYLKSLPSDMWKMD